MKKKFLCLLTVGLMTLAPAQLLAQDEGQLLEDTINAPEMDVDGDYNRPSEADKLAKMREKMARENNEMVEKKIEDMRIDSERQLTGKLRDAFRGKPVGGDSVETSSASPVRSEVTVEENDTTWNHAEFKVIPTFGVLNISNEKLDLESKMNTQLAMEAVVTKHVTVGLAFGYMNMNMVDVSSQTNGGFGGYNYNGFNQFYNNYGSYYGYNNSQSMYNSFYGNNYQQAFGQGREMTYKRFSAEISSKFFLFPEKRIRPYAGLGINYNRGQLSYKDKGNNYQWNNFNLGNEDYRSSYVGATAMVGAEVSFTKNIGMSLDFRYGRGLTSGSDVKTGNTFSYNPDQIALENLGQDIEEADTFGLMAGIVISF